MPHVSWPSFQGRRFTNEDTYPWPCGTVTNERLNDRNGGSLLASAEMKWNLGVIKSLWFILLSFTFFNNFYLNICLRNKFPIFTIIIYLRLHMEQPTNCFLGPTFLLTFLKNSIHCETQQRLLQIKRIKNTTPITTERAQRHWLLPTFIDKCTSWRFRSY